ncbi:MAG: sulfatase-like hydrolase/transferase [Candidatus Hydrogenedentes bacterium]|nr:sulfatase-like hydrolase/transferase [Candidatus Hydrogenedentota bacterium]
MKNKNTITRRGFLGTAALSVWAGQNALAAARIKRPNVLLIITDQQVFTAMSCTGNKYLNTPAVDSLAAEGTRFAQAYTTQPLCLPHRSSIQTGRYPHEIGTVNNGIKKMTGRFPMLGELAEQAGYECQYVGKWHVAASPKEVGYPQSVTSGKDYQKAETAVEFLLNSHDKPFFLTASFLNPHNVCQLARGQELPEGPIGEPPTDLDKLPPLPPNFAIPPNEPSAIREVQEMSRDYHYPTKDWDELKWRQYLWGYYRLVEKVDAEISKVLKALNYSGLDRDTVVIFVSDHGEGVAMHHWNQKQILYDEATHVPMIIAWKGVTRPKVCDELVSVGLDLPVTILDFMGADKPASMKGLSLKPIVMGRRKTLPRDHVFAETMFARGAKSFGVTGRMVRTKRYKYCIYNKGENREQLFDMNVDPGETVNLAVDAKYRDELNRHRKLITDWAAETNDSEFPYILPNS